MALTLTYLGLDQVKGSGTAGPPTSKPLHLFRVTVNVSGTYATGGDTVDVCQFFSPNQTAGAATSGSRMGVTAVKVYWAQAFGDYYDGTNSLTAETLTLTNGGAATAISAASTGNKVLVKLFTGNNGAGGSEVANATALSGAYGLVFAAELTFGSAGAN